MSKPNRASPEEAASFVDKYSELEEQIASYRSDFMLKCKRVREQQRELLEDAKSQGVPKKVVRNIIDIRRFEAKAKEKLEELEDDHREQAIDIRRALGDFADLPLGLAAVSKGEGADETTSAVVDAVRDSMTDEEWEAAGASA